MTRSSLENYSYDFPMAGSSSSSTCSASIKIHVRHHNHHRKASNRAADVARILDPSYTTTPPSSPRRSTSGSSYTHPKPSSILISAYVDGHGDLHDPDYRDFPALSPTTPAAADDDDDDSAVLAEWAPAEFANERKRRLTEASANSHYAPAPYSPYYNGHTFGSLPSSYTSPSPLLEEQAPKPVRAHLVKRYRSRRSSSSTSTSPSSPYSVFSTLSTEEEDESSISSSDAAAPAHSTTSLPHYIDTSLPSAAAELTRTSTVPAEEPTATPTKRTHAHRDALRRQWQAVSLRVRFGVFRAGRRWGMV